MSEPTVDLRGVLATLHDTSAEVERRLAMDPAARMALDRPTVVLGLLMVGAVAFAQFGGVFLALAVGLARRAVGTGLALVLGLPCDLTSWGADA